jgi:pSer/pThr/pTyr-binding forkhead associated (FHA) protein
MKVRLIERGADSERTRDYPINQPEFLIGRGADCDLRLRTRSVSRHHCLIRLGTDEAFVTDLGSSNGTYLNGQPVRSQSTLHTGDELQVGSIHFVVDLGDFPLVDSAAAGGAETLMRTQKLRGEGDETNEDRGKKKR